MRPRPNQVGLDASASANSRANPRASEVLTNKGCAAALRLSKFYIKEACLKQRDNELGLNSYNTLTCSAATDSAPGTCSAAFNNGVHKANLSCKFLFCLQS